MMSSTTSGGNSGDQVLDGTTGRSPGGNNMTNNSSNENLSNAIMTGSQGTGTGYGSSTGGNPYTGSNQMQNHIDPATGMYIGGGV